MDDIFGMALGVVQGRLRSLLLFALVFRLLQVLILLPLLAMIGRRLTGRPVVDSTDLVRFGLSPRGLITGFFVTAALFTLYLMEQAGLTAIAVGELHEVAVTSTDALKHVAANLPQLLWLAVAVIWRLGLILLPLLAVSGLWAWRLLRRRDINYYLDLKPPEAIAAAVTVGVVALATGAVLLYALVHWRLAVPMVTLEAVPGFEALSRSARASNPYWPRLLLYSTLILGGGLLLLSAVSWAVHQVGLVVLGSRAGALGLAIAAAMATLAVALHAVAGAVAAIGDASLFATAWEVIGRVPDAALVPLLERIAAPPDHLAYDNASRVVLGSALVLLVLGGFNAWRMSDTLADRLPTTITAHRGSPRRAPENSLSAIRQALDEGADCIEVDVQETQDGALVLLHDADLARQGGVARKVSEMTLAEVQAVDIGARGDPAFAGERVITLDEALAAVDGKARLMVELKYYPGEKNLASRVVEAIRARGMTDQVLVQSLTYRGVEEVRRLAPRMWAGYTIATPVSRPERLDVDFYAVNHKLLDPAFVVRAHRRGRKVAAWTVNDPKEMLALAGMGVDNLITDVPAEARRVMQAHWDRDPLQRRLQRLRAWLGG